jgi:hypothetical protein
MSSKDLPADLDKPVADKPASEPQKVTLAELLPDHTKDETAIYGPQPKSLFLRFASFPTDPSKPLAHLSLARRPFSETL